MAQHEKPKQTHAFVYKRADGKWAWRLRVNGDIVATDGGQGYENQADCKSMCERVIKGEWKDVSVLVEQPKST